MRSQLERLGICLLFLVCSSFTTQPAKLYRIQTQLSAYCKDTLQFSLSQQVLFSCHIDQISPIDQSVQKLTLIFQRIQAQADYKDQKFMVDTDSKNIYSPEFGSLKKLLNKPIEIKLNKDRSLKDNIPSFQRILQTASLESSFISRDFIEQIVQALLAPNTKNPSFEKLYFPFQTTINVQPTLTQSSTFQLLSATEPLELEGLYSSGVIQLSGKLKKEAQWQPKEAFVERYQLSHQSSEKEGKTLFENPLSFEYAVSLQQVDPLS